MGGCGVWGGRGLCSLLTLCFLLLVPIRDVEIPSPAQLVTQTPVCYLKYSLHVTSSGSPSILSFFHFYLIIMLIAIGLALGFLTSVSIVAL